MQCVNILESYNPGFVCKVEAKRYHQDLLSSLDSHDPGDYFGAYDWGGGSDLVFSNTEKDWETLWEASLADLPPHSKNSGISTALSEAHSETLSGTVSEVTLGDDLNSREEDLMNVLTVSHHEDPSTLTNSNNKDASLSFPSMFIAI